MAEEHARWKQYEYAANSNLVLTSERKSRGDNEPSGEAESLANKKLYRMGDKVQFSKPAVLGEKKEKIEKRRQERAVKDAARKKTKVRKHFGN
jgi:pre-mRNA-splicing helicase BRR2